MITERQEKILNTIVQEYIISAQPVSSQLLEKRHNFGICQATIRIEMQRLTDGDFIFQPHTSAGRVRERGFRI
jgi:heat-inducible transcriptional repressor